MLLVPCPTAVVWVHRIHLTLSTMSPESPLKKMPRGLIPEYDPAMSLGSARDSCAGSAAAYDVNAAPAAASTRSVRVRWRRMLTSPPSRAAERLILTRPHAQLSSLRTELAHVHPRRGPILTLANPRESEPATQISPRARRQPR